jgi:hypothetical protein
VVYSKKIKAYTIKRGALIIIGILCLIFIFYAGYIFYRNIISEGYADGSSNKAKVSSDSTVEIVRTKLRMGQGELLDINKVEMVKIPLELVPKGAITSFSKLNRKRLRQEVGEKEFLNEMDIVPESTSFEEDDRLIEHNFAEGAVPAIVAEGSYIDIKLFKNGEEDRIVISKAAVVSRNANLMVFFMNAKEQEYLKEAAAEGLLFAVQYLDDSQKASEVTYVPPYDKSIDK